MSDLKSKRPHRQRFTLGQIAPYLEKDPRTLRRWCQLGLVPGARRTRGGHWRIYGIDRASVLRGIRGNVFFGFALGVGNYSQAPAAGRHKARRRRENAYPVGLGSFVWRDKLTPRQAWLKVPASEFAARSSRRGKWIVLDQQSRNLNRGVDRARILEDLVAVLRAQREDRPDITDDPWMAQRIEKSALQQLIDNIAPETAKDILQDNETWEKSGKGWRLTVAQLASMLGISRRTFYRWFPGWRRIVFNETTTDLDYGIVGTDSDDETVLRVEPIDPAPWPGQTLD